MSNINKFFWIHIKKSGGQSIRQLLQPYYALTDRSRHPECFVKDNYKYWNDILNNYRIPLGKLQFRRAAFAKQHLYPTDWSKMYTFAFVREPIARCLSMYRYFSNELSSLAEKKGVKFISEAARFDFFLQTIKETRKSKDNKGPCGLHFATHTNTMWNDITDQEGKLCLTKIFRLEDMMPALREVYKECGLCDENLTETVKINQTAELNIHKSLGREFQREISLLYEGDFYIYNQLYNYA